MVLILLECCSSFHCLSWVDSLGSRRGVIGVDVDFGRSSSLVTVGCFTGQECCGIVHTARGGVRVPVAYDWMGL